MSRPLRCLALMGLSILMPFAAQAESDPHHHPTDHGMTHIANGMVMNENRDILPDDCPKISRDYEFKVIAGISFASAYADTTFGFNQHQWQVEPCSRITITFKNEDEVRHQWMIHRLPKYIYDQGMFHMEAAGGTTQTGTFIVPSDDRTYLVHCDIAQHMEKGMKAQLVVGKGSGDLTSIPGLSVNFERPNQAVSWREGAVLAVIFFVAGLLGLLIIGLGKPAQGK